MSVDLAVDQFPVTGNGLEPQAAFLARRHDPPHFGRTRGRDGNEQFIGAGLLRNKAQVTDDPAHRHPVDFPADLAGGVVQETHHRVIQLGVVMNFPQNFLAAAAGPEDQQFLALCLDMPLRTADGWGKGKGWDSWGHTSGKKACMPSLTPEMSNILKHQSINATDRGTFL